MKKKVKVSIVSILKHAPLYAQCISALQKMSEGSSWKIKKILWEISWRASLYTWKNVMKRLIMQLKTDLFKRFKWTRKMKKTNTISIRVLHLVPDHDIPDRFWVLEPQNMEKIKQSKNELYEACLRCGIFLKGKPNSPKVQFWEGKRVWKKSKLTTLRTQTR
jgi:hypothetical protein